MTDTQKALRRVNLGALFDSSATKNAMVAEPCSAGNGHFGPIQVAKPDAIFHVKTMYAKDTRPQKINLGVGAYRTEEGKPYPLKVVLKAEELLAADMTRNKEYLPISGSPLFCKLAAQTMFGKNSPALAEDRVFTCQSISGTGSLRLGMEFVKKFFPQTTIFTSTPTWGNHKTIIKAAGLPMRPYRYWDAAGKKLNFAGMVEDLRMAPKGSTILLHACAHNPTGVDPTREQWRAIAQVCRERGHLPFFDSAYQGFASGDLDNDAWAVQYFVREGFECVVSQSFAKNVGLYCERTGTFNVVCSSAAAAKAVGSQVKLLARWMYSNPPAHGARIVEKILSDPTLYKGWRAELKGMSDRINTMRHAVKSELIKLGTPGNWDHITSQIGMFSFTGLTVKQCEAMKKNHGVYLLNSGRISMAGLNSKNVAYFARAVDDVVRNY